MSVFGKEPPFTAARNDRASVKRRKRVNWIWLVPMAGAAWLIVTAMRAFEIQ